MRLDPLFRPESIAVIGASDQPTPGRRIIAALDVSGLPAGSFRSMRITRASSTAPATRAPPSFRKRRISRSSASATSASSPRSKPRERRQVGPRRAGEDLHLTTPPLARASKSPGGGSDYPYYRLGRVQPIPSTAARHRAQLPSEPYDGIEFGSKGFTAPNSCGL